MAAPGGTFHAAIAGADLRANCPPRRLPIKAAAGAVHDVEEEAV
jgi:hypothetical protein